MQWGRFQFRCRPGGISEWVGRPENSTLPFTGCRDPLVAVTTNGVEIAQKLTGDISNVQSLVLVDITDVSWLHFRPSLSTELG